MRRQNPLKPTGKLRSAPDCWAGDEQGLTLSLFYQAGLYAQGLRIRFGTGKEAEDERFLPAIIPVSATRRYSLPNHPRRENSASSDRKCVCRIRRAMFVCGAPPSGIGTRMLFAPGGCCASGRTGKDAKGNRQQPQHGPFHIPGCRVDDFVCGGLYPSLSIPVKPVSARQEERRARHFQKDSSSAMLRSSGKMHIMLTTPTIRPSRTTMGCRIFSLNIR